MNLTYIQQSGEPVGDGGDQYTGLDRFGRVIDQRWLNGSGVALDRIQYGFDRASNRLYRANVVAEAASANQDEYYTYDTLNQLLTLQRGTLNSSRTDITGTPAAEEDFTFDPTGNWDDYQTKASGSVTLDQTRTHNPANEITEIESSSATIGQDAVGNVTKAPKPTSWGAANTLVYDAWNRLVQVKDGSTTVATYAYDGQNRRTTKATGSTTRHYYYTAAWQIVEERTGTTADRQNVWGLMGLDNLILRDRGTERFYLTSDVFNATAIVNTSGTIQERYGYAAFGQPRFMDGSFGSRTSSNYDWETLFGDYRHDSESGYYQVRFRYLHPTLGRWLARDPIEYQGGINLYTYVGNGSTNSLDYFGLKTTLRGPSAEIFSWIESFLPSDEKLSDYYTAYEKLTGSPPSSIIKADIGIAISVLSQSANPEPPDDFNIAVTTLETRGWLSLNPSIDCDDNGNITAYNPYITDQNGWTPLPTGGYDPAQGNVSKSDTGLGKPSITITVRHRSRIGLIGQGISWALLGTGVPYNWREISYTLDCKGCYSIKYSASNFPSHKAYFNDNSVYGRYQSGLASFMFSGSGVDAPGAEFYHKSGDINS